MTYIRDHAEEYTRRRNEIVVAIDLGALSEGDGIDALTDLVDEILARLTVMQEERQ